MKTLSHLFAPLRWLLLALVLTGLAGNALAGKTYTDNLNGTVTDVTTGLTWMRCAVGQTWDGSTCTGGSGVYTWDEANALTGTVSVAGQSDWRLPTIRELQTLVDRSVFYPAIDSAAFPNTVASAFSSASAYAGNSVDAAWLVKFDLGYVFGLDNKGSSPYPVRLVRAGQSFGLLDISRPSSDYVDHANGTVTHTPTGLMWQTCAVGQSWSGGTCTGTASSFDWDAAQLLTSNLAAYSDWRLPSEDELLSLVDYSKYGPAMNTSLFPNAPSSNFRSASADTRYSALAWLVDFSDGLAQCYYKDGVYFLVRLVRAGQSFGSFGLGISKTGAGQVASSLPYLVCGSQCAGSFTAGTVVTLNASPAANFTGWGGACSGTVPTCSISMNAAKSVTASFLNAPLLSDLPKALAFDPQNIGSSSATQALTLSNPGTLPLTISSISATGDFAVSHDCGTSLGAGGSCTLNIRFTPTLYGLRTGAVSIISNAATSPNSIALRGIAQVAKTYSDNLDGTVSDPTTGLTWMRCAMGQSWDGSTCTGTAATYTWDQASALTGTGPFAGQSDWRLPTIRELQTIVDRSVYYPAIDSAAFPNTDSWSFWWASADADYSGYAWEVFFYDGGAHSVYKGNDGQVRLVRAGQSFGLLDLSRPSSDYVNHANGTVTHTPTGLMWQKCAVGQSWSGSTCTGVNSVLPWDAAKLLSNSFASYSDWRLPTEDELLSLVDYSKTSPHMNTSLFPNAPSSNFWSASAIAGNSDPDLRWDVDFGYGYAGGNAKDVGYQVRLVRAGQSFGSFPLNVSKTGNGTVSGSALTGISCGSACTGTYTSGTTVILTATPASGWSFTGWSGACTSTAGTCTVNMTAAQSVTATFGPVSTGTLITRYRLYSDGTKEHLYTTDANEYSVLPVCCGWLAEGAIYKLFQGAGSLSGVDAVQYYRLYNPLSHQHHWTTDANEYNVLGTLGWSKEGIDGYILPTAVVGSVPLYRLYLNAFGGLHLWTTDANEKDVLSTSNGWVDEGVAGWVVPLQ